MKRYTTVEEQVEYGLDTIDPDRMVEVNLRDLMYMYKVFELAVNYFHQPMHYPDIESVIKFLGNGDAGFYHLISEAYYNRGRDMFPRDICEAIHDSVFQNPDSPYYYKPNSSNS